MNTTSERFSSGNQAVPWEIFRPAAGSGGRPAVLVLHGSFGMLPAYRADIVSFADALAARGIAAAIPHYLEATDTRPGAEVIAKIPDLRSTWQRVCTDALQALARDANVDADRLGLLGFSLGANLGLSVAMDPPAGIRPKCVVDFFGPTQGLEAHWAALPPVLILHGSEDRTVPPSESAHLVAQLDSAGKKKGQDYRFTTYQGEDHGFKGAALAKSRDETIDFIEKTIRA